MLKCPELHKSAFAHSRFYSAAATCKFWHIPWHQFVFTLFISCGHLFIQPASFRSSSSLAKHLPTRRSFIFGNRKKSDGARSGPYGGCSKITQWNCSRSKACVCWPVCGRALLCNRTIPCERAFFFGKIT